MQKRGRGDSGCPTRKQQFQRESDAKVAATKINERYRRQKRQHAIRAYKCRLCRNWHVGRMCKRPSGWDL